MESTELLTILEQLERDKGIDKKILIEAVESAVATAAKKAVDGRQERRGPCCFGHQNRQDHGVRGNPGDPFQRIRPHRRANSETSRHSKRSARPKKMSFLTNTRCVSVRSSPVASTVSSAGTSLLIWAKPKRISPKRNNLPKKSSAREIVSGPTCWTSSATSRVPRSFYPGPIRTLSGNFSSWKSPRSMRGSLRSRRSPVTWGNAPRSPFTPRTKRSIASVPVWGCAVHASRTSSPNCKEKIDIVRYSSDIKEYIQAALSPAEISQIQLNYDGKKANIIVADDQLSLAIGKHGQNVRPGKPAGQLGTGPVLLRSVEAIAGTSRC